MKVWLPASLVASVEEFAKGPGARHGRSNSLKWPWLYDKLRAKGYDKSKAAAISNSRIGMRKSGRISVLKASQAHNPAVLRRLAKADRAGKHSTRGTLKASAEEFYNKNHSPKDGRFIGRTFKVITAAQARGDSRPVSHAEFQRLARIGQRQLDTYEEFASPHTGLNRRWTEIKAESYREVQKPWGGATIDAHSGLPVETRPEVYKQPLYALTVKSKGQSVSVHENASEAEFNAAMDTARRRFSKILTRQSHYLGVFHDDENHRIDIDPVIVVTNRSDVDTIGAATHAIGGAYNFADGNGYWPPHVSD